jgi:hypothetical protein
VITENDTDYEYVVASEEDRLSQEIWELTIPGRITINVHLSGGVVREISRQGEGQRLRLTTYDRKVAQEMIRERVNDPFTNGMLIRVDLAGAKSPKAHNELDDAALGEIFKLDDDDFTATVDTLSEVNVRRLKAMARKRKAHTAQIETLDETLTAKWPIGADMPSNKEARGDTD